MVYLLLPTALLVAAGLQPPGLSGLPVYNEWQALASLPGPRAYHMAAPGPGSTGLGCWVFGGASNPGEMDNTCLGYDVSRDSWFARAPMPVARGAGRAILLNGMVLVMGGVNAQGTALDVVESYDPVADTWTESTPLPERLQDFGAAAWRDGIVYLLGGGNWLPGSPPSSRVWRFDPDGRLWHPASPLPVPLGASCAGIFGDTILVATGWTPGGATNRAWRGIIDPARPDSIAWQELDTLPARPRSRAAGAALDGRLIVSGGTLADRTVAAQAWSLDRETGTWLRLADKPTPTSDVYGAASLRSRVLVPGGYTGSVPYTKAHEALDLGLFRHDVGIRAVLSPLGRLLPDSAYPARAVLLNNGTEPERPFISFWLVDSASRRLVFAVDTALDLDPGQEDTFLFGSYSPDPGRIYEVRALTFLADDENRLNDTVSGRCRTTAGSEPDGYGYIYLSTQETDSIDFQWQNPVASDTITGWHPDPDDGTAERGLPFPFLFYGDTLNSINVCTNGFLSATASVAHTNRNLPLPDVTHLIAPFWDDLTLRAQGSVLEKRYTDRVIYSWVDVPRYGDPGSALTFQAILFRGGNIQFNFLDMYGSRTSSTAGIQGFAGTWDWYTEYVTNGTPCNHVIDDSVTIVFRSPDAGIAEPGDPPPQPSRLRAPSLVSGRPVPLTVSWSGEPPKVDVYDASGALVAAIEPRGNSPWTGRWDMKDDNGRQLVSGTYFLKLHGAGAHRLLVVR